jgi:hypothetical protein
MEECVNGCEFLEFINGKFRCKYYNKDIWATFSDSHIHLSRCKECEEDGLVGKNTISERIRKLKKYMGWMADSFYSHKDEFEDSLTEMYRIIKAMEDENEKDSVQDDKGD